MAREPIKLALSEPVISYGEPISELNLGPPKGKDILECGYPWSSEINPRSGNVVETVNVSAARLMLSRMAQVPEATIDQIAAVDFYQAVEVLRFFFRYKIQKPSSTSSSDSAAGPEISALSLN